MLQDWERAYRAAMLETDQRELVGKIDSATAVLEACLLELGSSAQESGETERIADALRTLELIRRLELAIPDEVPAAPEETDLPGVHQRAFPRHHPH